VQDDQKCSRFEHLVSPTLLQVYCLVLRKPLVISNLLASNDWAANGQESAFIQGMRNVRLNGIRMLSLLFALSIPALGQSARGTLTLNAVVETSATWIQGADGKWTMVVANAPDSLSTFFPQASAGHVRKNDSKKRARFESALMAVTSHSMQSAISERTTK
jgi:hypothetical protein